jgi:hypothetical protein
VKTPSVRETLREAYEEVDRICEAHPEVERRLGGVCEQLRYAVEGGTAEPEAVVAVERGALDTIQRRIAEVVDELEGQDAVEPLGRARERILLAVVTLEDQWKKQH